MKNQWIVVANASLARFFEGGSPEDPMVARPTMDHSESRLKGSDLAPDRDGCTAKGLSALEERLQHVHAKAA